jgi:hypothetical protein
MNRENETTLLEENRAASIQSSRGKAFEVNWTKCEHVL